jgi:hypothetical protein
MAALSASSGGGVLATDGLSVLWSGKAFAVMEESFEL